MFFFFNDTATTEIYTLSLHDALPIYCIERLFVSGGHDTLKMVLETETLLPAQAARDGAGHNRLDDRSEEHMSELQSRQYLVCRLLLEKKKTHYILSDIHVVHPRCALQ